MDCPVVKTFEDGNAHQSEMVVTSRTGDLYNVLIWTAPIRNAAGEIVQVMELLTNITQIRQLQDHLSSLGLLIGSISHGIKGLLTGLDGGMYLVSSGFDKENTVQIQEGWETVKLMADRIRSMVLNILYYAKKRKLNWEKVDAIRFAHEVAATVESKMASHHIRFVKSFALDVGQFEIDVGVVHSALINILENAMDACLADRSGKNSEVWFVVNTDIETIVFEVKDNGAGMDPETRDNLFTLFFSTKGKSGTGLGLFISNKIIEQHGGRIQVESTPGSGSCFRIHMPKTLPESAKNMNS
jgi:signal transduction histidine kinase